jgi:peptide/nickel transport system substrate-binding protein
LKRIVLWMWLAALLVGFVNIPVASAENPSDVAGTPFEKPINALVEAGVLAGFPDGTFRPEGPVTRAQLAKMVVAAFGLNPVSPTHLSFSDVIFDHWALGYVEAAAAKGWVKGYPNGTFCPEKDVTREELATLMIRLLGREQQASTYQEAFVPANDCAKVSPWAWGFVTLAYHTDVQLLTYHPGRMIDPQTSATRGETANAVYFAWKPLTQGSAISIAMTQEPSTLYPYRNGMAARDLILNCIDDNWVGVAPEGSGLEQKGTFYPILAQEVPSPENGLVKINLDGTMEVTWHLRKTPITWSDNIPLTLEDALFGHDVLINKAIPADSRDPEEAITQLEVIDPHTLRVVYQKEKSTAIFGPPILLARHRYWDLATKDPEGFIRGDINTYLLGHGPYTVVSWVVGSSMTLSSRSDYHFGPPSIKTLTFLFIPDPATIFARMAAGTLDLTPPDLGMASVTAMENLDTLPGLVVEFHPSTSTEILAFNMLSFDGIPHSIFNPASDPDSGCKVRQAIAAALDIPGASQVIYQTMATPATSFCSPAVSLVAVSGGEIGLDLVPSYNPEKARRLLDEAGWKDSNGDGVREKDGKVFTIQLTTTNRTDRQQLAVVWQKNLLEVGIEVELDFRPESVFFNENWVGAKRGFPDMAEFSIHAPNPRYPDINAFRGDLVATPSNPAGTNYTGWQNADFDQQAQLVVDSFNLGKARLANLEAQRILLRELPAVPLFFPTSACLYKTRLQGVQDPNWGNVTWNVAWWYLE